MIPVFPLGSVFFPGEAVALRVFEERYLQMFADLAGREADGFVTVLIERGREVGGGDKRFDTGVVVLIREVLPQPGMLVVTGIASEVVRVVRWAKDDPYPLGDVESLVWGRMSSRELQDVASALSQLAQSLRSVLARHRISEDGVTHPHAAALGTVAAGQWCMSDPDQDDVERAYWAVARCMPCGPLDRYALLGVTDGPTAVRQLRSVLEHTDELLTFGLKDER